MLLNYIRVITDIEDESALLVDRSLDNQDDTKTVSLAVTNPDYIYVAQRYPFTNLYFHMDTVNSVSTVMTVEYWDGTVWREGVDLMDGTSLTGKMLGRSGGIQFSIQDDYSWGIVNDTSDSGGPDELATLKIYNCYWMRLKSSGTLSASTDSKEICYSFTNSQRLKDFDVELDGYLASFATGKTDWIDEIKTGSKLLVQDLKRMGLIMGPGQIIELDDVYVPCSLRTLALIYSNLGPSYKDKHLAVMKEYDKAMNIRRFTFDADADGKLTQREIAGTIKRMYR